MRLARSVVVHGLAVACTVGSWVGGPLLVWALAGDAGDGALGWPVTVVALGGGVAALVSAVGFAADGVRRALGWPLEATPLLLVGAGALGAAGSALAGWVHGPLEALGVGLALLALTVTYWAPLVGVALASRAVGRLRGT